MVIRLTRVRLLAGVVIFPDWLWGQTSFLGTWCAIQDINLVMDFSLCGAMKHTSSWYGAIQVPGVGGIV
jgi:hypothetical protein